MGKMPGFMKPLLVVVASLLIAVHAHGYTVSIGNNIVSLGFYGTEFIYGTEVMSNYQDFRVYDGVAFKLNGPTAKLDLYFEQDYRHDHPFLKPWGNLIFEGHDANQQNHVLMKSNDKRLVNPPIRTFRGRDITLKNVSLEVTLLDLLFGYNGASTLSLENSQFFGSLGVATDQTLNIESVGGTNKLLFLQDIVAKSTAINVHPSSTLVFAIDAEFQSPVTLNVNQGSLHVGDVSYATLDVDLVGSSIRLDGSYLVFNGSDSTLNGRDMTSLNSEILLKNNTHLNLAGKSVFTDTLVTLNNGSSFYSENLLLTGNNRVVGLSAKSIDMNINIESGTLDYQAMFTKGKNAFGSLYMKDGTLILGKDIDIEANLNMEVSSRLLGNFNIVDGHAFLSSKSSLSGTLHFNKFVRFLGGDSWYLTTLHPNAVEDIPQEIYRAELLSSGESINGLDLIVVEGDAPDARDYDAQTFLVANAPSVSGTQALVHGGSLPALVDFDVMDDPGVSGGDVTLIGKLKPVASLVTHPAIQATPAGAPLTSTVIQANHPNAQSVATVLTKISSGTTPVTPPAQQLLDALLTMTNAQVADHLNSLHAEPYSSHMTIGLEQSDLFLNMVMDHAVPDGTTHHGKAESAFTMGNSLRRASSRTRNRFWIDSSYVNGDVDGDNDLGDFGYTLTNLVFGTDLLSTEALLMGAYGGYGFHTMDEHDSVSQEFETDTYHLGMYGSYTTRHLLFTGVLGYFYGRNETERAVTLGEIRGTAGDTFNSQGGYAGLRGAVPIALGRETVLTPNLGVSYSYLHQERVDESGFDAANLIVDSADAHSFVYSIGLHATYAGQIRQIPVHPMAFVKYEHDGSADSDATHDVDAAFAHSPDVKTSFSGQNRGENLVLMGVGVEVAVTPALCVAGGVSYSTDTHGNERGVGASLVYSWP